MTTPYRRPQVRPFANARPYDAVAWRPPSSRRHACFPANDWQAAPTPTAPIDPSVGRPRGWITVVAGGLVAVLLVALVVGVL